MSYGADWTEYGAHVVDSAANEVRFPLDALWASSSIDAVGIDYYAPLADWRDDATALDRALSDSQYRIDYLAGNLARGEAYDWYYTDTAARERPDAHADHRWARQAVDLPAEGHLEFLVAAAL